MKNPSIYTIPFSRKRKGKTDYRKRMKLLLSGATRLVVRKSLKGMWAALVSFGEKGDVVQVSATVSDLRKLGWQFNGGNMPSSYLVGLLLGKKAKDKKIDRAVVDFGLYTPVKKSRMYATVAGVIDAGIAVPCQKEVLPSAERMAGQHISSFATQLQTEQLQKQFSHYQKTSIDPKSIEKQFNEMKSKIMGK